MHHDFTSLMKSQIESESWDTIARMALSFQIGLSREDRETAKLKKEMSIIKHILYENMKTPEMAAKFLNTGFFVRLYQTVDKLERAFERHRLEHTEFLFFLRAVLQKIKKEKLVVHKPLERKAEFRKHKDAGVGML